MAFNDNDFTGMSVESSEVHNLDLFRFVKKYSLPLSFEQQDNSNWCGFDFIPIEYSDS